LNNLNYFTLPKIVRITSAYPESKVTITVGDKNGFAYTVNGVTHSDKKIAVSGQYYDDEVHEAGYARLFLVVDTGVAFYDLRPQGNVLDVYIRNYAYDEFYYSVICPQPVVANQLRHGQTNATAVLITGPSRSTAYYPRLRNVQETKLEGIVPEDGA
jgi:hypothetical protein